jgi:alanyl-tRNA synthetase
MTERLYYTSRATAEVATVVRVATVPFSGLVLDRTIFVPQGGGQPSDVGYIGDCAVTHVESDANGEIVHVGGGADRFRVGETVRICIDADRHWLHSRLHSAGHAIAVVVEALLPAKAESGHHWPGGEARVEFAINGEIDPAEVVAGLEGELRRFMALDLPLHASNGNPPPRTVKIGDHPGVACGGTHVTRLSQIGTILVRGVKFRKGLLRVSYDVR